MDQMIETSSTVQACISTLFPNMEKRHTNAMPWVDSRCEIALPQWCLLAHSCSMRTHSAPFFTEDTPLTSPRVELNQQEFLTLQVVCSHVCAAATPWDCTSVHDRAQIQTWIPKLAKLCLWRQPTAYWCLQASIHWTCGKCVLLSKTALRNCFTLTAECC